MSAKHYYLLTKYKSLFFKFPAMTGPRMREICELLRQSWYVQYSQSQLWKYTVKNENNELLENPMSTIATIFNTLGGIFGEVF